MILPTAAEVARRDQILDLIRTHIREGKIIPYRPSRHGEPPEFGGDLGEFRYLFEGEDDLLHLKIERRDAGLLAPNDTSAIARFLLPEVPEAMVWLRPGVEAHHYYLGHDLLCPPT